jgi:hypothetical protein
MTVYNLRLCLIHNNEIIDQHVILDKLKAELTEINWKKYENMTNIRTKIMGDMYYSVGILQDFSEKVLYETTKNYLNDFTNRIENLQLDFAIQFYIFRHLDI